MIISRTPYLIKVTGDYNTQFRYVKAAVEASGVTLTVTQNNAGDRLIRDIYGEANASYATTDIHNKFNALYGVLGGTEDAHKWNWMDTRDLDDAFRLRFVNSPTHSANGVDWNGSTQYANTRLIPSAVMSLNDAHISYYSRETEAGDGGSIGGNDTGGSTRAYMFPVTGTYALFSTAEVVITPVSSDSLHLMSRVNSTNVSIYRGSTLLSNASSTSSSLTPVPLFLGCRNSGGSALGQTTRQCAFASVGSGLTSTEVTNLYNAVQAYQTSLSRNV